MTMFVMASVVFYQIFIPINNLDNSKNLITKSFTINFSGLIPVMFFIFFPIMSDVINQVKSYEITYFHIIMLMLIFLLGVQTRERILSHYLKLMVILSVFSFFYFFTELLIGLPSNVPYWGIPNNGSHFYYFWSQPVHFGGWFMRNQSIWYEPGAFGFHLIIATLLAYKAKNELFITILIFACLTTMSTTVYLFLFLLLIYHLFFGNNKIHFIGVMLVSLIVVLVIIRLVFGNFDFPLLIIQVVFDKFDMSSTASGSTVERTQFLVNSVKLFFDNIFLGAGHYSTSSELRKMGYIGSETSALGALLAELGIFGIFCILLYANFFKHFKLLALPIAVLWLNGEMMTYTAISLFILTHMVDEVGQKLFPAVKK